MHDAKNRPLAKGDIVLIPCRVTDTHATDDYCNVGVETLFGRRPDGAKEHFSAFNTGVVLRANAGDENDLSELPRD